MTKSGTAFPSSLGKVAPRELAVHGIARYEHVEERSERELLAIHGGTVQQFPMAGSEGLPSWGWRRMLSVSTLSLSCGVEVAA